MGNYALPTNSDFISSDYWDHRRRNPPSQEAGTDFGVGYGSPMYSPFDGVVVDVKHSNTGAMGRYAKVNLDDGKGTRGIHGAEIWVAVGQRVSRGQQIGLTGGSAYGSNTGVGSHIHQTLWPTWDYAFGDGATINFMDYVGSGAVLPHQRVVGANGASVRRDPSTKNDKLDVFPPGTLADFNGWIRGENVEGNDVWFRGAISGVWLWSGGFTDSGTHDLEDLNPKAPAIGPNDRKALADGVRARKSPSTTSEVVADAFIAPGAVGGFTSWITGEGVEGNTTWFKGANGYFYWSGGFEDKGTHNLADLNTPAPPAKQNRVVGSEIANIRAVPFTSSAAIGTEPAAGAVEMTGWTNGQEVEGNKVWFQRYDGKWMWSGGFTSQSVEGLTQMATPVEPTDPVDNLNNPAKLRTYTPIWDGADFGLEAPLGFQADGTRADRNVKGAKPNQVATTGIIDRLILHWTGVTPDQLYYFSILNDRDSCPSYYFRSSGKVFEMIRPGAKPASTGPEWNWRSIAVEMLRGASTPTITRAQQEKAAQLAVRMQEATVFEDGIWDGAKINFRISAESIVGHNTVLPGTECPGPDMDIPWIVARAQAIWDQKHPSTPTPEPSEDVLVSRAALEQIQKTATELADWAGEVLK